jgi:hypothetical protein
MAALSRSKPKTTAAQRALGAIPAIGRGLLPCERWHEAGYHQARRPNMSKRAFRSTPTETSPSYPTLRRFLGRRAPALAGLALGLLASGCGVFGSTGGVKAQPPSIIDARTDGGLEAGPQSDAGPAPAEAGPQADLKVEAAPPSNHRR